MNSDIWWGAIISIPVGILSGLITIFIAKKLKNFGLKRNLNYKNKNIEEYEMVSYFRENPHDLSSYLSITVIKTALTASLFLVFAALVLTTAQTIDFTGQNAIDQALISKLINIFGLIISLIGALLVINICMPAIGIWKKYRNFSASKKPAGENVGST